MENSILKYMQSLDFLPLRYAESLVDDLSYDLVEWSDNVDELQSVGFKIIKIEPVDDEIICFNLTAEFDDEIEKGIDLIEDRNFVFIENDGHTFKMQSI